MSEEDRLAANQNNDSSSHSSSDNSSKASCSSIARSPESSLKSEQPTTDRMTDPDLSVDADGGSVSDRSDKSISRASDQGPHYPPIPSKRYFTIGEISHLCKVSQHVLRYWERFFPELKPARRQNHRYYSHQHVYLVRHIRDLLKRQGFTISGARRQLTQGTSYVRPDYSKQTIREIRQELEEMLKQAKL